MGVKKKLVIKNPGAENWRKPFGIIFTSCLSTWIVLNPYLSKDDSYWYIVAGRAIKTNTWTENYVWNRTPGYPTLVALSFFAGNNFLLVLATIQVILILLSFRCLIIEVERNVSELSSKLIVWKAAKISGIVSLVLLGGYGSALLPQSIIFVCLCWTIIFLMRCQRRIYSCKHEVIAFLLLIFTVYIVHPICAATLAISYQSKQVASLVRFLRRSTTGHPEFSFIKTVVAPFSCVILLIFWTNISNSKSQEQSEQRIAKLKIEPLDRANAGATGVITPDPNFQNVWNPR